MAETDGFEAGILSRRTPSRPASTAATTSSAKSVSSVMSVNRLTAR